MAGGDAASTEASRLFVVCGEAGIALVCAKRYVYRVIKSYLDTYPILFPLFLRGCAIVVESALPPPVAEPALSPPAPLSLPHPSGTRASVHPAPRAEPFGTPAPVHRGGHDPVTTRAEGPVGAPALPPGEPRPAQPEPLLRAVRSQRPWLTPATRPAREGCTRGPRGSEGRVPPDARCCSRHRHGLPLRAPPLNC
jgi:hypothetical protein